MATGCTGNRWRLGPACGGTDRMNRFFQQPQNGKAVLSKEDAHHLTRVLRKHRRYLGDCLGRGAPGKEASKVYLPVIALQTAALYRTGPCAAFDTGHAKGDKWTDYTKAVELGVTSTPVRTEHGDVKPMPPRAKAVGSLANSRSGSYSPNAVSYPK